MFKTTLKIEGMACGMCEAHISDVIAKTGYTCLSVESVPYERKVKFLLTI
ncbi:MAG: hypothetical protein K6F51_07060 [Acetatifactor sp.]|nr:hypothetical protein [Acetatifactor sp.]